MTSVRPKLKPETPKAITGWDTQTGAVVWMARDGSWTRNVSAIGTFTGHEADAKLASAGQSEGYVTDPYFMEVSADGQISGREVLRETIRANGPTVRYGNLAE